MANRVVRLENTNIHQLCEAERETLKTLVLHKLAQEGFSNVTLPKGKQLGRPRLPRPRPLIKDYDPNKVVRICYIGNNYKAKKKYVCLG